VGVGIERFRTGKNAFILTLYPFVFHLCFVVFYFFENTEVLIIAEEVCLVSLLIGSVHIFITVVITNIYNLYKLIESSYCNNRINPTNDRSITRAQNVRDE
jgi:uncharacterized membrane protein (DUF485 family)